MRARVAIASLLGFFWLAASAAAQIDLAGRWRLDMLPPFEFIDIEQVGSTASFTYGGFLEFSGQATNPFAFNCAGDPICADAIFAGNLLPDNSAFLAAVGVFPIGLGAVLGTRCECDDGNAVDGDGCGADCRIEPCFSCSGTPSLCAPLADGQTCDDRRDCTSGETCAAGVCGAASPVSPCIDMTGTWDVTGSGLLAEDWVWQISQRAGNLFVRDADGAISDIGTIDVATGEVALRSKARGFLELILCDALSDPTQLDVDPSGDLFTGERSLTIANQTTCVTFEEVVAGARRGTQVCGDGVRAPPEQCDDGNLESGDCCGPTCLHEAYGARCGLGCGACAAGVCNVAPLPASACAECDVAAGCKPALLLIRDKEGGERDAFSWSWPGAAALPAAALGVPSGGDAYQVCVFDESTPTPSLLLAARVGDPECANGSCWQALGQPPGSAGYRFAARDSRPDGIFALLLRSGAAGAARISVRGRGDDLRLQKPLPLSSPLALRAQLSAPSGACWQSTFAESGALRSDDTIVKARSD